MQVYEHRGRKYISLNGKDYFLIRAYENGRNNLVFFQVSGRTALNKEDLPNSSWRLLKSRAGPHKAWTAFNRSYFKYGRDQEDRKIIFIGATAWGSCRLALKWVNDAFNQKLGPEELSRLAVRFSREEISSFRLTLLEDQGNTGEKAALLDLSCGLDEQAAQKLLKGGQDA